MQVQKFLVTSALYLSLAGSGAAFAGESDTERKAGKTATSEARTVGNDKLRFTIKERQALEKYTEQEKSRRAMEDAHGSRDPGDGKHKDKDKDKDKGKQKPLPPGLQKKVAQGKALPPGWQKKLARGEVMDADVYAAAKPLPPELKKQLPADPPGTITVDIDGEVVRVIEKTRKIADILRQR